MDDGAIATMEYRPGQEEAIDFLVTNINAIKDSEDGPHYFGIEAATGLGKTLIALRAFQQIINFGDTAATKRPQLYVFVRTRSQVQSFLRECGKLGLSVIAVPSKSSCCPNNEFDGNEDINIIEHMSRTADRLEMQGTVPLTVLAEPEPIISEERVDHPLYKQLASLVNGKCMKCPLSLRFHTKIDDPEFAEQNAEAIDALREYHVGVQSRMSTREIINAFVGLLMKHRDLDTAISKFREVCPYTCPYSIATYALRSFDVVILTYPYLLQHDIRESFIKRLIGPTDHVVLDEAHNLNQIRNNSEDQLMIGRIETLLKNLDNAPEVGDDDISRALCTGAFGELAKFLAYTPKLWIQHLYSDDGDHRLRRVTAEQFTKMLPELPDAISQMKFLGEEFERGLSSASNLNPVNISNRNKGLIRLAKQSSAFCKGFLNMASAMLHTFPYMCEGVDEAILISFGFDPETINLKQTFNAMSEYRVYYDQDNKTLEVRCLGYYEDTKRVFEECKSVTFLSGTLHSAQYFERIFGINVKIHTVQERVGKLMIIRAEGVTSKYDARNEDTYSNYAELISDIHKTGSKHTIAVFPSNAFMNRVAEQFRESVWTETDQTTASMLEHLQSNERSICLIVAGSRLSEGVEFIDPDGLSYIDTVGVVGIPIPPLSDFSEDWGRYLKSKFGFNDFEVFETLSLEPAFMKVRQAIGRAIRGPRDSAKAFAMDERYSSRWWRGKFPNSRLMERI